MLRAHTNMLSYPGAGAYLQDPATDNPDVCDYDLGTSFFFTYLPTHTVRATDGLATRVPDVCKIRVYGSALWPTGS